VFPSAVLLALFGWNGLLRWLRLSMTVKRTLAAMLALSLVFLSVKSQDIPVGCSPERQLLKHAAGWLKTSEYANRRMFYFDPYWWFFMEMDPTDQERMREWDGDVLPLENSIQSGEIVLWDAHFGPNEGRVPLARLMEDPCLKLIRAFRPATPLQTLGGYDYEIFVFMRKEDCE
jgi:hypothetical protein